MGSHDKVKRLVGSGVKHIGTCHKIKIVTAWPEKKLKKEKSYKLQAASLTANPRDDRMINERNIMEYATKELERIADAIEEILHLIKKDMREIKKAAK